MNEIKLSYVVRDKSQLEKQELELLDKAEAAIDFSHSPYSNFRVASVVRMQDGKLVSGTNQENAAYPSSLCAERVAIFSAKGNSNTEIDSILVIARNGDDRYADAFSCGNCRQVMIEYANLQKNPIKILMGTKEEKFIVINDVKDLLPFHFNSDSLT